MDTFGENETKAFAAVMGTLANVSAEFVNVTVSAGAARRLLATTHVAIGYEITVPDVDTAVNLRASIKAVPPPDLVVQLKAVGLTKVQSAVNVVSETVNVVSETVTDVQLTAVAPSPAPLMSEPVTEDVEVLVASSPSLAPLLGPTKSTEPDEFEEYDEHRETVVAAEADGPQATSPQFTPPPAASPQAAPPQAAPLTAPSSYVVAAVDLIGYSPETFGDNATSAFETTTAEVVGVLPDAVEVFTVDVPIDRHRSLLALNWGVIKTASAHIADEVRTSLKTALHDSPEAFVKQLISNGMSDVTGVKEVPVDNSSVRKVLVSTEPPGRVGSEIVALLVACGFFGTLVVAASCYALVFRKRVSTNTYDRMAAPKRRAETVPAQAVRGNARARRGGITVA